LLAALLAEPVLTADESPVEVVTPAVEEQTGQPVPGAPHVLVLRTPDERLVRLTAADSRRHEEVLASLRTFTGYLIVDGYGAYQRLLPDPAADPGDGCGETVGGQVDQTVGQGAPTGLLAGIQQCCQHISRRCKQVAKLGPGGLQSWAPKIVKALGEAHANVAAARADGHTALDPKVLADLRARYDDAVALGIVHEVAPKFVELRWRPDLGQAALLSSSCTTGPTVLWTSASSAARRAGRCRWPLTRRNCLPASSIPAAAQRRAI